MASILRSSKFVRYIAGFARNIVVNTPREFDGSALNATHCVCGSVPRSFASQASIQHEQSGLDSSLRRLDQDVRKTGRISKRDIEEILEEIKTARSATSSQSLLVIRCCGNLVPEELPDVRTKLVQEIWKTFQKLNVPMDVSHYNALLRVYLENEHEFSPTDFLAELASQGIEPNRVTYQRLIAKYCQKGNMEGATKILTFMKDKQLPVNENVFNSLIMGHSQCGDMESAQGILAVMSQAGLEPSADTYATLLTGFAKMGNIDTMKSIIEECEAKDICLLDKDFLDIIHSLAINGHDEHVPFILGKIRKTMGYSQDSINIILRLINQSKEDIAFEILKTIPRNTRTDGTKMPIGAFFIKQLVKSQKSIETIKKYCELLNNEKLYENGLPLATEISLDLGDVTLSLSLMKILQSEGFPIRQHYFWPLIISNSKAKSDDGIVEILLKMPEFNLQPNLETIREYVIPNMKNKSSEVIAKLREGNISVGVIAMCLVHRNLLNQDADEAAFIITSVPAYYHPDVLLRPLANTLYTTQNIGICITILRGIVEHLKRYEFVHTENKAEQPSPEEVVSKFVCELMNSPSNFKQITGQVLSECLLYGLGITVETAEKVQHIIGEKMTNELSDILTKLSSGELTPVSILKRLPTYVPSSQMNIPQLERLIHNLDGKSQDTRGLKRQLFNLYYRAKDLDKLEAILKDIEGDSDFVYTPGMYVQLLDIYSIHDKFHEATVNFNKLRELDPNFVVDDSKIIKYTFAMAKEKSVDEVIEFLKNPKVSRNKEDKTFFYNNICWKMLNHFAEQGRDNDVKMLFDVLTENNYMDISNVSLGPLIKVHVVNDNLDKALETFEWCCNQFKCTPWKNELTCQLIQKEDAEKLQKLTDLSTPIHGEINSLYDLVFAFVECGRMRQARKILETPGLQNRPNRFHSVCERYQLEGMIKPLESLKDVTKDLNYIDRSNIYYQLLLSYIKQEDAEKAVGLWTQMQEEDLTPNDKFLQELGTFLKSKNMEVPFAIPNVTPVQKLGIKNDRVSDIVAFRQHVKSGNIDQALAIKRQSKERFNGLDLSMVIERLVQVSRLEEATKLTIELIDNNITPVVKVFRFLLTRLASNGRPDLLEQIGSKLSSDMKKILSFDNRVCNANLASGNAEEYLNMLEKQLDEADEKELVKVEEQFPRGGAIGIMEDYPNLIDRYEALALKYMERGIVAPLNVLWTHYFIIGDEKKTEFIWNTYLHDKSRLMFQRIVHSARTKKDEALVRKLIDHLKRSNVTEGAIGIAQSCLLDIISYKNNPEQIVKVFESVIQETPIEHLNRTAVMRVKNAYSALGKPFNYDIPQRKKTSAKSSSSTSSGEEHASRQ